MSNPTSRLGFAIRVQTLGPHPITWRWCGGPESAYDETGAEYIPLISNDPSPSASLASDMKPLMVIDSVDVEVIHRRGEFYEFETEGGFWSQAIMEIFRVVDNAFDTTTDRDRYLWVNDDGAEVTPDHLTLTASDPRAPFLDITLPRRTITTDAGEFPNAADQVVGKILPIFYGHTMYRGIRFCEAYCVDKGEPGAASPPDFPKFKYFDTRDSTGASTLTIAEINSENNDCHISPWPCSGAAPASGSNNNSRIWILPAEKYTNPKEAEVCANVDRRVVAEDDTVSQNHDRASFVLDLTILSPDDGQEAIDTEHVVTTDVPTDTPVPHQDLHRISARTGTLGPGATLCQRVKYAINNGILNPCCTDLAVQRFIYVAKDIDPEKDRVFGKPGGYKRFTPAGGPFGSTAMMLAGEIAWHLYVKQAGAPVFLFDSDTFFANDPAGVQGTPGGTYSPNYKNFGYFSETHTIGDLLGSLYFENGLVETVRNGLIGVAPFSPFAPASAAVFAVTPRNATGFTIRKERWAEPLFNVFTMISQGHPMDQAFRPEASVTVEDPASIAAFGRRIPYSYKGFWLDGAGSGTGDTSSGDAAFFVRASEIVALHAANQRILEVTVQAPTEDALAAMLVEPGDYVTVAFSPEDPDSGPARAVFPLVDLDRPAVALVLGVKKSMRTWTTTWTLLRLTTSTASPGWCKWTDGSPMFPASLSGETGYGTGSAAKWNDSGAGAWSDKLVAYAKETFGYWGVGDYIDPLDPRSYLGSRWS